METYSWQQLAPHIAPADKHWHGRAEERLQQLTMPPGAMGRLLPLSAALAAMTRSLNPSLQRRRTVIMAADHGVTAAGVSAFPQEVTMQMLANFVNGGATINALAREAQSALLLVDMGVAGDKSRYGLEQQVLNCSLGPGTDDLSQQPAMTRQQACQALEHGWQLAVEQAPQTDIFALGEMGIGNTTASSAVIAALLQVPAQQVTGAGTGLAAHDVSNKARLIDRALAQHQPLDNPLAVLSAVGGFEIGGLAGFMLGAASCRRPVVLDGVITAAAGLLARALAPACSDYFIASHGGCEPGLHQALQALQLQPLLDLELRLGEGSGAVMALPLVSSAARLLHEVATFAEAAVNGGTS